VTHPDIERFFMTIPEASRLVLQAGLMGKGGEVFVLDMGDPVRIADLARDMIRLSNLVEGRDIEIQYTGLRPGEKLYEELFDADVESMEATEHPKIVVATPETQDLDVRRVIDQLGRIVNSPAHVVRKVLASLVPHYEPGWTGVPATIAVGGADLPEPSVVVAGRIGPDSPWPARLGESAEPSRALAAA